MATDPTTEADRTAGSTVTHPIPPGTYDAAPTWFTVAEPQPAVEGDKTVSPRRVLVQLVAGILGVLAVVTVGGALAAHRLAEREAVNVAAGTADVLAETVVQPSLSDALLSSDPRTLTHFDTLVRDRVLGDNVLHVKLWSSHGKVLYSDESELMGRTFPLDDDQLAALHEPSTRAEISSLDRDENQLDSADTDKLVEVYRPVWTPNGGTLLFEIYAPYERVSQRSSQLWRGFAGVTVSSLLLFVVLLAPLIYHLAARIRREQRQREQLLQRSVDASSAERRMIAASLHDGPVQDLAATSFVVSAAATRAQSAGQQALYDDLRGVAASVRTSIRALRTLLVDIYPASLAQAGLAAALDDLGESVRGPGLDVVVDHTDDDPDLELTRSQERLVYRIAQETLRNAAKHALPCTVTLAVRRERDAVVLEVADDGPGFDAAAAYADPEPGHFGLRLLADLAEGGGADLAVATAPGRGTRWRLVLPVRPEVEE